MLDRFKFRFIEGKLNFQKVNNHKLQIIIIKSDIFTPLNFQLPIILRTFAVRLFRG